MKLSVKLLTLLILVLISSHAGAQKFAPVKEIPEGKALVYIYRPGSMVGALVHYTVNVDGKNKVSEAHLVNNSYLIYFAEPGSHTFWRTVSNKYSEATLTVKAGETYYIRGSCCDLIIPTLEMAQKSIVKCNLSKP